MWNNPWLLALLAPALLVLGAGLHHVWSKKKARERRRIPKHWPLSVRSITNSEEARVWHWLSRAFYDHHIMIKLPVTRFTMPREQDQGMEWYSLLGGVYCSFTICKADGRVVGCIDVPGKNAMPRSTRLLKHSLRSKVARVSKKLCKFLLMRAATCSKSTVLARLGCKAHVIL